MSSAVTFFTRNGIFVRDTKFLSSFMDVQKRIVAIVGDFGERRNAAGNNAIYVDESTNMRELDIGRPDDAVRIAEGPDCHRSGNNFMDACSDISTRDYWVVYAYTTASVPDEIWSRAQVVALMGENYDEGSEDRYTEERFVEKRRVVRRLGLKDDEDDILHNMKKSRSKWIVMCAKDCKGFNVK